MAIDRKSALRAITKAIMLLASIETKYNDRLIRVSSEFDLDFDPPKYVDRERGHLSSNIAVLGNASCGAHIDYVDGKIFVYAPSSYSGEPKYMEMTLEDGKPSEMFAQWFVNALADTGLTPAILAKYIVNVADRIYDEYDTEIIEKNENFFSTFAIMPDVLSNEMDVVIMNKQQRLAPVYISRISETTEKTAWATSKINKYTTLSFAIIVSFISPISKEREHRYLFDVSIENNIVQIMPYLAQIVAVTDPDKNNIVSVNNKQLNVTVEKDSSGKIGFKTENGTYITKSSKPTLSYVKMRIRLDDNNGRMLNRDNVHRTIAESFNKFVHSKTKVNKHMKDDDTSIPPTTYVNGGLVVAATAEDISKAQKANRSITGLKYLSIETALTANTVNIKTAYPANGAVSVELHNQHTEIGDVFFTIYYNHAPLANLHLDIDDALRRNTYVVMKDLTKCIVEWNPNMDYKSSSDWVAASHSINSIYTAINFIIGLIDAKAAAADSIKAVKEYVSNIDERISTDSDVVNFHVDLKQNDGGYPYALVSVFSNYNNVAPIHYTLTIKDNACVVRFETSNAKWSGEYIIANNEYPAFDDILYDDNNEDSADFAKRLNEVNIIQSKGPSNFEKNPGEAELAEMSDKVRANKLSHIRPNLNEQEGYDQDEMYLALKKAMMAYKLAFDPDNQGIITFSLVSATRRTDNTGNTRSYVYSTEVCDGNGGSINAMEKLNGGIGLYAIFDGHKSREIKFDNSSENGALALDPEFEEWFRENCRIRALYNVDPSDYTGHSEYMPFGFDSDIGELEPGDTPEKFATIKKELEELLKIETNPLDIKNIKEEYAKVLDEEREAMARWRK